MHTSDPRHSNQAAWLPSHQILKPSVLALTFFIHSFFLHSSTTHPPSYSSTLAIHSPSARAPHLALAASNWPSPPRLAWYHILQLLYLTGMVPSMLSPFSAQGEVPSRRHTDMQRDDHPGHGSNGDVVEQVRPTFTQRFDTNLQKQYPVPNETRHQGNEAANSTDSSPHMEKRSFESLWNNGKLSDSCIAYN